MTGLAHEEAVEAVYALLNDHGWAGHYRCGWEGETPPSDGMCGKEWQERQSVSEMVTLAWSMRRSGDSVTS